MVRIGVTGLMASGKSTVARRFEERGAIRIDGDALGWETLRLPKIRARIAEAFGSDVLGPDGAVDRARLGAVVFRDAGAMERLNAIVQPSLVAKVRERLAGADARTRSGADAAAGADVVVLDAALISTWGLERELDGIVEVTAPDALRIGRLERARGIARADAAARVQGQSLPPVGPAARLWRIENGGDEAALRADADRVWDEIARMAAGRRRP